MDQAQKMKTNKKVPFPQIVSGDSNWKVFKDSERPRTSNLSKEMYVPFGDACDDCGHYHDKNVRRHELAHVKWSPATMGKLGPDESEITVEAIEEMRIHYLLAQRDMGITDWVLCPDKTEKMALSDIWEPNQKPVLHTILKNELDEKAQFFLSDNFKLIPKQSFDLIVANPPHFNGDPYVAHYDDPRKYKDLDWSIHKDFFNNVGDYLSNDGVIILAENVWGSNPDTFKDMIAENNLKITHHFPSKQYPLDMWYLGIARESAER